MRVSLLSAIFMVASVHYASGNIHYDPGGWSSALTAFFGRDPAIPEFDPYSLGHSVTRFVIDDLTKPDDDVPLPDGNTLVSGCHFGDCGDWAELIVRPDKSVAAVATLTINCGVRCCDDDCYDFGLTIYVKPTADWPVLQRELWFDVWRVYVGRTPDPEDYPIYPQFPSSAQTVMLPPDKGKAAAMPGLVAPVLRPAERSVSAGDCAAMAARASSCADDRG